MAANSGQQPKKRRGPGRPFQKGQSGNPSGRPKEFPEFRQLAREVGAPKAFRTLLAAMEGSDRERVRAAEAMLAYAWGKPTQAVEVTGKDGKPLGLSDDERAARIVALVQGALARDGAPK